MEINFEWIDVLLVSPALALVLASLIPITIKVFRNNQEQNPFATVMYGLMGITAASLLCLGTSGISKTAFSDALVFDGLSTWVSLIVLGVTFFALIYAKENLATATHQFSEFTFLLLNSAAGMLILAWSNDLVMTFIGIELMSLCLYLIIALSRESTLSKEAAFKYFVLGSFASAVFLYGVAFIYGTVGSTYIPDIAQIAPDLFTTNRLFLVGMVLVLLGLCFKVSVFPFHAWAPDVYQGAPTPVTAFMATGVKAVSFAVLLRVVMTDTLLSERAELLTNALQWLAAATILVGNIAAILQNNVKRMLAYSSIAHSGYVMIGLIAAGIGGEAQSGATSLVYYVFAYSVMTIGAFGAISLLEKNENSILLMDDLKGLASRNPWVALSLTVLLVSLSGLPPTIGFFGKFFIFSAALNQGLVWLAVWGVIGSAIGAYYYLRPIVMMYMHSNESAAPALADSNRQLTQVAVVGSALLVVVIGLATEPFYRFVSQSISSLF